MDGTEAADFHVGQRGEYHWLTAGDDVYMGTIVSRCPEIVMGRYLAVTSIDSGEPWLTERQVQAGWQCRSGIVYSRAVQSLDELFYQRDGSDSPGFDEWYVFEKVATLLGVILTGNPFVESNMPGPERIMRFVSQISYRIDRVKATQEQHDQWFWEQIERIHPESYIADGWDCLTFVTRNPELFKIVTEKFEGS